MKKYIINFVVLACFGVVEATNNHVLNEEQQNDLMRQVMQIIWEEAMEAKEASNTALPLLREELLEKVRELHKQVFGHRPDGDMYNALEIKALEEEAGLATEATRSPRGSKQ